MAGRAELSPIQSPNEALQQPPAVSSLSELQLHAARLLGSGLKQSRVANLMLDHLVPDNGKHDRSRRLQYARAKVRRWNTDQTFRDAVWAAATVQLDSELPAVLSGIADKAKRGRVDAARLALEVTGRHNPKGEDRAPTVVVQIDGIVRPARQIEDAEIVRED